MAKFVKEFKEFATRGNVMDMAVGVIIGGAFGKIISSVVDDLIMPLVGKLLGNVNFTALLKCQKDLLSLLFAKLVFQYSLTVILSRMWLTSSSSHCVSS